MPASDTNDSPIDPDQFINKLVGALWEVTFTLKHYAINAQKEEGGQDVKAHDMVSAQVETVVLLKNSPTIVCSPYMYKGQMTKRPQHRPQILTMGTGKVSDSDMCWQKAEAMMIGHPYAHVYIQPA